MVDFNRDINLLLSKGFKFPSGKQFDRIYVKLKTGSVQDRVLKSFIDFQSDTNLTLKMLENLYVGQVLVFLYVQSNKIKIKRKLNTLFTSTSRHLKLVFSTNDTFRDLLLSKGDTFYERATNLLKHRDKTLNSKYRSKIENIFAHWLHTEYILSFVTAPKCKFENKIEIIDQETCLYDSFVISALQPFYVNNYLEYTISHFMYGILEIHPILLNFVEDPSENRDEEEEIDLRVE